MPRVRLVRHSLRRLPAPLRPPRKGHQGFGNCFSAVLQFPKNSLSLRSIAELASRSESWQLGFGNWPDDGRAVSRICHSLVRPSLRRAFRHGIQRARRGHTTTTLVVDGSFPIHESRCGVRVRRLSNVHSAELDNFLGSLPPSTPPSRPPPSHSLPFAALSTFGRNKLIFLLRLAHARALSFLLVTPGPTPPLHLRRDQDRTDRAPLVCLSTVEWRHHF